MTAFDYSTLKATATRLIDRFGGDVTFTPALDTGYDDEGGRVSGTPAAAVTQKGVLVDITDGIDNQTVLQGDKMLIVDSSRAPLQDDVVTADSEDWQIINIATVKPSTTGLIYKVQLRK